MRQFLLYNHVLTEEEIEFHAESGVPESPPTLAQFKEQIDLYESLHNEITAIPDHRVSICDMAKGHLVFDIMECDYL